MGASISVGHGAQKVFDMKKNNKMRVVSCLGDSTFFHTGINSLINVIYNKSNTVNVILDNRITGMTGHQENPGSGYTLQGEKTVDMDIEAIVRALGFKNVLVINPNDIKAVKSALDLALSLDELSVIITRWPCALNKFSSEDKEEFGNPFKRKCTVDEETCIGCKLCIKTGCPALSFDKKNKKGKYRLKFMCRMRSMPSGMPGQIHRKGGSINGKKHFISWNWRPGYYTSKQIANNGSYGSRL